MRVFILWANTILTRSDIIKAKLLLFELIFNLYFGKIA